ncbi:hypothetical protein E2320_009425 [Naja naja]|nr:hypothetical protein E2320_009425 [Naja naja]
MSSGRSLWVVFAVLGSAYSLPSSYKRDCSTLPTYTILCQMPAERFFYNVTSKSCQFFIDYGCSGSLNSYHSAKECEDVCKKTAVHLMPASIPPCHLPPQHGSCKDKIQRWFYDPKTQSCKTFTFGGCKVNANNFNTRAQCQRRCHKRGPP